VLEVAAVVHYFRNRPQVYWLYFIIFLGPPGAAIYLGVEAVPDFLALSQSLRGLLRQRRITELEALVEEIPSTAN
jgi:hypothetical protein